jgi:hypothetical protein
MRFALAMTGLVCLTLLAFANVSSGAYYYRGSVRYGPRYGPAYRGAAYGSVRYGGVYRGAAIRPLPAGRPYWAGTVYNRRYAGWFHPGYRSITIGSGNYFYYPRLPVGYRTVVAGPTTYYVSNNVYYRPYIYGGQTVYLVVPPPPTVVIPPAPTLPLEPLDDPYDLPEVPPG